jgi:hypothetical protein
MPVNNISMRIKSINPESSQRTYGNPRTCPLKKSEKE